MTLWDQFDRLPARIWTPFGRRVDLDLPSWSPDAHTRVMMMIGRSAAIRASSPIPMLLRALFTKVEERLLSEHHHVHFPT